MTFEIDTAMLALERLLRAGRFLCATEAELQLQVAQALDQAGVRYTREKSLSRRDRPDFMLAGGLALELKTQTDQKSLLRQLLRYAEHAEVRAMVVGTTTHRGLRLPPLVGGKPLRTVHLVGF